MVRILILAYDFPPYVSVGGLRPYSWYSYFKELDVDPIVVTRQWGNAYGNHLDFVSPGWSKECVIEENSKGTIIRTPYFPNLSNKLLLRFGEKRFKWLRKVISAYYEIMQFYLLVGPKKELFKAADAYLAKQKVDVIIATGEPFVLFHYASKLSETYNIPWIADYRDPWTQNFNKTNWIFKQIYSGLEKRIVSKAKLITTVSSYFETQIRKLVPESNFSIIENGYDEHAMKQIEGIKQDAEMLRIGFVGTIYEWHPLGVVLETLNRWITESPDRRIELHFHGTNKNKFISDLVSNHYPSLIEFVYTHPKLPNELMLKKLARYNAFLLFNYYAFVGTKIYDYIGIKRKIIFCFTEDSEALQLKKRYYPLETNGYFESVQEKLILETNAGVIVRDSEDLFQTFNALYNEHIVSGKIKCLSRGVELFSRKLQAENMVNAIKNMC